MNPTTMCQRTRQTIESRAQTRDKGVLPAKTPNSMTPHTYKPKPAWNGPKVRKGQKGKNGQHEKKQEDEQTEQQSELADLD